MTTELLTDEVRIRLTPTEKQQLKSLAKECDVYIVKTEIFRTEVDANPWTTGLSSEVKTKQYALELAETGSLQRALQLAGYLAKPNGTKPNQSHYKPIQTTSAKLAEFVREQRPDDPEPIVHNIEHLVEALGAEIADEVPICNHGQLLRHQCDVVKPHV